MEMDMEVGHAAAEGQQLDMPHSAAEDPEATSWQWPQIVYNSDPDCVYLVRGNLPPLIRAKRQPEAIKVQHNFFKGVKWSPDGTCFLTCKEDRSLHVFDLPSSAMEDAELDLAHYSGQDSFSPAVHVQEGETVYDYCWYPGMTAADPASCCFLTTSRAHPIHLWDAVSGELRCSYRAYDQVDEITPAFSVAFNPTGDRLFCGYLAKLRVFDTSRPGRDCTTAATAVRTPRPHPRSRSGSRSEEAQGQQGIISSLAFSPDGAGAVLAAGSYDRTTALYDARTLELLFVLHGQTGGVTQVQFSRDGNYLYTGGRKDPGILCWDIRNTSGMLYRLERASAGTNQRIQFDIEPAGRHLATGGQDGGVRIYDLQTGVWVSGFPGASDTVNGVSYHPCLPLLATSSGQRHFELPPDVMSGSSDESDGEGHTSRRLGDPTFPGGTVLKDVVGIWRFQSVWDEQSTWAEALEEPPSVSQGGLEEHETMLVVEQVVVPVEELVTTMREVAEREDRQEGALSHPSGELPTG